MKPVAGYQWGKTENGYGWQLWQGCQLSIEKNGTTGSWEVYEADGSLLCACLDYRSAQKVVARLRRLTHAQVTPDAVPDYAYIAQDKQGWVAHHIAMVEDYGETFPTLEAAERYLGGRRQVSTA